MPRAPRSSATACPPKKRTRRPESANSMTDPRHKANVRLALVLLSIVLVFFVGFVAKLALHL